MYFNGCYLENVYINKLLYGIGSNPPESDVGYRHLSHRVNITRLSAIHFNNSTVKNFNVENVHAAGSLPYVFDGNTALEIKARNVTVQNEKTLIAPENIKLVEC